MPQHRHGQCGVVALVVAGQGRQRQRQLAMMVPIFDRVADIGPPVVPAHVQRRPGQAGAALDLQFDVFRIVLRHQRRAGAGNSGLLEGDAA